MVKKSRMISTLMAACVLLGMVALAPYAYASDAAGGEADAETLQAMNRQYTSVGEGIRIAGGVLAAGIAIACGAFGTARAQAAIGAGGTGALAEKPDLFVSVLVLVALPETIIVLSFVVAFLILGKL